VTRRRRAAFAALASMLLGVCLALHAPARADSSPSHRGVVAVHVARVVPSPAAHADRRPPAERGLWAPIAASTSAGWVRVVASATDVTLGVDVSAKGRSRAPPA
jgi:hypothetical protein